MLPKEATGQFSTKSGGISDARSIIPTWDPACQLVSQKMTTKPRVACGMKIRDLAASFSVQSKMEASVDANPSVGHHLQRLLRSPVLFEDVPQYSS